MNALNFYSQTTIENLNKTIAESFPNIYPIQPNYNLTLKDFPRLVMLDRYSQKDKELKTLKEGDVVITTIKHDPRFPSRGIGKIIGSSLAYGESSLGNYSSHTYFILIEEEFEKNIDPNLLISEEEIKELATQEAVQELY